MNFLTLEPVFQILWQNKVHWNLISFDEVYKSTVFTHKGLPRSQFWPKKTILKFSFSKSIHIPIDIILSQLLCSYGVMPDCLSLSRPKTLFLEVTQTLEPIFKNLRKISWFLKLNLVFVTHFIEYQYFTLRGIFWG